MLTVNCLLITNDGNRYHEFIQDSNFFSDLIDMHCNMFSESAKTTDLIDDFRK